MPYTGCKYCGSATCYGACQNNVKSGRYHSTCPHCGSNTCDLRSCYKAKYDGEYAVKSIEPVLPPLPKGELIGYRCWNIGTYRTADPSLVEVGGQLAIPYAIVLRSMNGTPWPGPVMHSDEKPTRHNSNGIYVLKNSGKRYDRGAHVSGSIMLYGKIVEHADGYRAEHAVLRQLTLHVHNLAEHLAAGNTVARQIAALAMILERRYECEVLIDSAGPDRATEPMQHLLAKVAKGTLTASDMAVLAAMLGSK